MKVLYLILLLISIFFISCEDVIDVNLNDTDPQLVITANVSPLAAIVTISETVAFTSDQPFHPISDAEVTLFNVDKGAYVSLLEVRPGEYRPDPDEYTSLLGSSIFAGSEFMVYAKVGDKPYSAKARAVPLVTIDSVGTSVTRVFDEERKFVMVKYQDPVGVSNYYQFFQAVNGGPLKTLYVTNDKFNDGKYVSEALADLDITLEAGDAVDVRMRSIDKATYDFWDAVRAANPGTAAPANPPSVFGSGALGYFSVYTEAQASTVVQ